MEDMLNIGEDGPFICCICQPHKPFKNSTGLRNHTKWKHHVTSKPARRDAKEGYKCDVCGMTVRGYAALSLHKLKKHGVEQVHKCNQCNGTFVKLRELHRHMSAEHGVQMFKCDECKTEFKSREGWRMHMNKMHTAAAEPSEVCYICGKAFKMPYQLKNHIKLTHKEVRDFSCHLCARAFKGYPSLKRHLLTFHSSDRSFACDICQSKFKTRYDMSSHRKLHFRTVNPLPTTGRSGSSRSAVDGSYACHFCSKTFSKLPRCRAHEKLVHETKDSGSRFVCLPCDKFFPNQYYLVHHISSKHRQRNHKCPNCERLYTQAYLLRRHLPKCSGAVPSKPFTCQNCDLQFATKTNLIKHLKSPGRCSGHDETVECFVLVDDGTGSLVFQGGIEADGVEDLLNQQTQETKSEIFLSAGNYQAGGDTDVYESQVYDESIEQAITLGEESFPVTAEEMCVVLPGMNGVNITADRKFVQEISTEELPHDENIYCCPT